MHILYEDDYMLALEKPSGITVNRSDTTRNEETVQDFVEKELRITGDLGIKERGDQQEGISKVRSTWDLLDPLVRAPAGGNVGQDHVEEHIRHWETPEEAFVRRSGIVHRLDKETSGILLVAKTPPAFIELQRQFKERLIHKSYLALAHGKIVPGEGEISVPVGRLEFNRKRFGVVAGGRESVTRYKTIDYLLLTIDKKQEQVSLVELFPETGRTHQIRVHLKHIGHPIFADELYGGRKTARQDRKQLPRLFLHAAKITFLHPVTGKVRTLESPLPQDLQNFLKTLQKL